MQIGSIEQPSFAYKHRCMFRFVQVSDQHLRTPCSKWNLRTQLSHYISAHYLAIYRLIISLYIGLYITTSTYHLTTVPACGHTIHTRHLQGRNQFTK